MAKEEKKNKKNVAEETKNMVETDIEKLDIEKRIDTGRCLDEDIAELGDIKEKEEERDRKIREYLSAKNKALYFRDYILLKHAKMRREVHILHASIKKAAELLEDLKGGKITPEDYNKGFEEFAEEQNKKLKDSTKRYDEYLTKLQNAYPGYWSTQWELERLGLLKERH